MSLTLVTGPANAAKAGNLLGAYRAALDRDPILVVPTRADVAYYTRELAGARAVLGGELMAFGGLVREIARRSGYAARPISGVQRERLIAEAVRGARLRVLARSAAAPGFLAAAGELIAELEQSFVTPQRFARALDAWARAGGSSHRAYAREIASIHAGYLARLERSGRVDDDLFAWRALDALRAEPGAWGATPVFLYGFDDLTGAQRDAVETLARIVGAEVTVSLSFEPGRLAFAGRARTFEDLRPLADAILALEPAAGFYARASGPALHHLERRLFEDEPGPPVDPAGAVQLLEAGGERAEVELVAAEVAELVGAGVEPERIAVVFRTPARYGSLVDQVFGSYGIPVAQDWTVPFAHLALGRSLLGLARVALVPEAPAAELISYLRAPGLLDRPELADRLEAAVRRRSLHTAEQARREWEEQNPSFGLEAVDRLRRAGAGGEPGLLRALQREATRLFVRPHRGRGRVLSAEEVPDARALSALARALEELGELLASGEARGGEPAALLDALARLEVRQGDRARAGAVLVSDPLGIRARRFRAVFVCGMQEGEFPRVGRPEPFLGEEQRRELAGASGLVLSGESGGDALAEERYLFYAAASRAEERLFLSYRVSDEEGNPTLPSFFLAEVRRLFSGALAAETRRRPLAEVTWPLERAPTPLEAARARAAHGPRVRPGAIGSLRSEAARAALRHQAEVSAGTLESYAECPVKWLVDKELQPRPLAPRPEPLARGDFAHRVLERTFARLGEEQGSARITPASLPAARRLLGEELERLHSEVELAPRPGAAGAIAQRAAADIDRYLEHAASDAGALEPTHLELGFGMEEGDAGALELDGGAVRVRGAIDRVDVDPVAGTAFVHDYKSGSSQSRRDWAGANWAEEGRLQVALYLLVVQRQLGLEPVGGVYQPLRGTDLRGRGLVQDSEEAGIRYVGGDVCSAEEIAAALAAAEDAAVRLARRLRAGELEPAPATCRRGGGCAHPGICRGAAA